MPRRYVIGNSCSSAENDSLLELLFRRHKDVHVVEIFCDKLANIAGPGFGGWLIGVVTAPVAVLATAGTYVVSAFALLITRDHEEEHDPTRRGPILHEIWAAMQANPPALFLVEQVDIAGLDANLEGFENVNRRFPYDEMSFSG